MSITQKANEYLLKEAFGISSGFLPATNWYIGLSSTQINSSGNVAPSEPTSGGYARVEMPRNSATWVYDSSEKCIKNGVDITFPVSTGSSWGLFQDIFIAKGSTINTADVWFRASLTPPIYVDADTQVIIAPGTFIISRENI